MLNSAAVIYRKDVIVSWRRRQLFTQLLPFALIALVLFGIAFDADRPLLRRVSPGLVWMVMLFVAMLSASRTFSSEDEDGARTKLRTLGFDPAGMFLGKTFALFTELLLVLGFTIAGIGIFFGLEVASVPALVVVSVLGVAGIAAALTLYSALTSGLRGGESVLPILVLPVLAPVLLTASRAWEDALGITAGSPWGAVGFLAAFAIAFWAIGVVAMGWMESQ